MECQNYFWKSITKGL
ncbi:MAG: hypothetical protein HND39_16650 [Ignavibacteriota bacterium]|nr:MAG: hypothetical protein EDM72_08315 [Chlorobiota bacterium]MBE7477630.1 hypothetical protein [Ignavibacteriales bacterium]MBL1124318.1 hypothetical protein [Ignavibacteriota bacterium]MCC7092694.1 hypothetical protein [Ignavibacteriaceae bacterium]MCE7855900.1 hypothetical protein [Ignavibacteria bacterium CHB3]